MGRARGAGGRSGKIYIHINIYIYIYIYIYILTIIVTTIVWLRLAGGWAHDEPEADQVRN